MCCVSVERAGSRLSNGIQHMLVKWKICTEKQKKNFASKIFRFMRFLAILFEAMYMCHIPN
jgi:hypothetical protein